MTDAVAIPKGDLKGDLRALFACPRELWIAYVAKFFESIGLFSLLYTVTLWLSTDYGMTDLQAGWWFGTFSTLLTVMTFFVGFFADWAGFRNTLIFAFATAAIARGTMAFATTRSVALFGLMFLTFGTAMGVPVLTTAIRRYTTERARPFGFSLYYALMNVGAAAAGYILDVVRGHFRDPVTSKMVPKMVHFGPFGDRMMTAYGMIFFVGLLCAILAFAASVFLRKGIDAEAEEKQLVEPAGEKKNPFTIFVSVVRERAFWRFMLFVGLLVMVKLIYQHYHATWPKYVLREMGEAFPLGKVTMINPIIIIFLVPVVTAVTKRYDVFKTILFGSVVSSLSVFILCFGASYVTIIGMVVVLSFGEALWLPRLYEYTAVIAPRGRESSYMSLSALPMFFAKMIVGPMGGYLLTQYCPEKGPRNSSMMWFIIGMTTIIGPILIFFLRGVIEGKKKDEAAPGVLVPTAGE